MELRELKLENSKTCVCGHEFTNADIKPPIIQNTDYRFYGGRVKYYTEAECPNCKRTAVLMLEEYNSRDKYRVVDISIIKEPKVKKVITQDAKIGVDAPKQKQDAPMQHTEGFICEKCGREFKSKSGLISHSKKCQGK